MLCLNISALTHWKVASIVIEFTVNRTKHAQDKWGWQLGKCRRLLCWSRSLSEWNWRESNNNSSWQWIPEFEPLSKGELW